VRFDPLIDPQLIEPKKMQWSDRFGKVLKNSKIDVKRRLKVSKNTQILFEAFFPCHVKCPERSEPLGFGHLRVFLFFPLFMRIFKPLRLMRESDTQIKKAHNRKEK